MIPSITAWRKRRSPGEDGFYLISSEPFDLIVLDVMLPGRSGLKIPSTARFRGLRTPVLILTHGMPWRTAPLDWTWAG